MATPHQPVVMSVSCPTCGAPAGHKCKRIFGLRRLTLASPHAERIDRYRARSARKTGRRAPRIR